MIFSLFLPDDVERVNQKCNHNLLLSITFNTWFHWRIAVKTNKEMQMIYFEFNDMIPARIVDNSVTETASNVNSIEG